MLYYQLMKRILNIIHFLDIRKTLAAVGIAAMFILLFLGPTMLRASERSIEPTTATTTTSAASKTAVGASNGAAAGFDPSTFNVKPITNPDGSITFPTYTIPQSTTPSSNGSNSADSSDVCATARAAMDAVDASYAGQNASLQAEITNYQNFLMNNTKTYAARGTGPTPDEQAANLRVNSAMQADNNQLMTNVRDANAKKAPYQQQWTANACV
jgi:hypothetical protein